MLGFVSIQLISKNHWVQYSQTSLQLTFDMNTLGKSFPGVANGLKSVGENSLLGPHGYRHDGASVRPCRSLKQGVDLVSKL
jgi:hypothetical protein